MINKKIKKTPPSLLDFKKKCSFEGEINDLFLEE
jgi:hypothetical protein